MLVVAPIRVCNNVWPYEVKKWKDFEHLKCHFLHPEGDGKTEAALRDESIDIYIINPEGLEWLLGKKVTAKRFGKPIEKIVFNKERFALLDCQMFVLDESSKFKNTQTKRFKILKDALPHFARRVILTGSPRPKNLLDLFGQIYIIDLGRSLGQFITHYRMQFFDSTGFGGFTWELKGRNKEEREQTAQLIYKKIKPYVFSVDPKDYIELPELIENDVKFDLPPDARKVYEEMEDDLIVLLESGEALTAPTAAAARIKCAQIAGGAIYQNPEGLEKRGKYDFYDIHDAKLQSVSEWFQELQGQPALLAYWFGHDLIRIRAWMKKEFGKEYANLPSISEVSGKKGKEMEDAWNRGDLPLLLAQPGSAGHGLNMQEGNAFNVGWFSLPDDFDLYDQFNGRLVRSGNKSKHVFATRFLAKRTVDEAKVALLRRKDAGQKEFLDAMRSYRRSRK